MKKIVNMLIVIILSVLVCAPQAIKVYAADETLRIMATSDVHNRFVGYDYATNAPTAKGGFSRVATLIEQNRTTNTVLLDNGDTIQGNNAILFNKDAVQPMVKALNLLKYDTYTTGNHEYNYGMDFVDKLKNSFAGDFLAANVYKGEAKAENRIAKNYTVINKNGIRIAVIGVVTPHIKRWDGPNLQGYTVTSPYDEVKSAVKEIKAKKLSDVIVVSFHASIDGEYGDDSAKEVANQNPDVDVVIAGHAHETRIERSNNDSVIIEPGSSGSHLAMVDLKLTKLGTGYTLNRKTNITATNLVADSKVSESPTIVNNLAGEHKRAVSDASTVIGKLSGGNLIPDNEIERIPQSQLQDTPFIELILATQLDEAKKGIGNIPSNVHHVSSAAVFNTSTNVLEGPLTKADVAKIYQFDNTLETMSINGAMLKKFMEANMNYYNQYKQGDLTVSFNEQVRAYNYDIFEGVNYTIDIAQPVGSRVNSLTYSDGSKVSDSDVIYLTVNNYRASGLRNTYPEFKAAPKVYESLGQQTDLIRDMIKNRIMKEQTITPKCDNNWKIIHPEFNPVDRQIVVKMVKDKKLEIPVSNDGRTPNVRSITTADIEQHKNTVLATTIDFSKTNENGTTPFGHMVTGLMKETFNTDVALLKKSTLQNPWQAGNVTYNHIYSSIPFNQQVGVYTITKAQLEMLIKENIEAKKMNLEYNGLAIEVFVDTNNQVSIKKITRQDGTALPSEMTIVVTSDMAKTYHLKETKAQTQDLQDLVINKIEPLDRLEYSYVNSYKVEYGKKETEKEQIQPTNDASKPKQGSLPATGHTVVSKDANSVLLFILFLSVGLVLGTYYFKTNKHK